MIRFQFRDSVDGYIELAMNIPQERSFKGWTLVPHTKPLRVNIIVYSGTGINTFLSLYLM